MLAKFIWFESYNFIIMIGYHFIDSVECGFIKPLGGILTFKFFNYRS